MKTCPHCGHSLAATKRKEKETGPICTEIADRPGWWEWVWPDGRITRCTFKHNPKRVEKISRKHKNAVDTRLKLGSSYHARTPEHYLDSGYLLEASSATR